MQLADDMRNFLGGMCGFLVAEVQDITVVRFFALGARETGKSSDAILKRRPDARFREQRLGQPVATWGSIENSKLVLVQIKLQANVLDLGFDNIGCEVFEDAAGQAAERRGRLGIV